MPEPIQPADQIEPIEPPAPVEQPDAEISEWDEVTKEAYPDLPGSKKDDESEPTDPAETAKPAEQPSTEEKPAEPQQPQDNPVAAQREINRQMAADFDAVKKDVAMAMFSDIPLELKDANGDPIRSVDDVMKLVDPRTGNGFTEEAAVAWLTYHQGELKKTIDAADQDANRITAVNIALKDDADRLAREYAEVLKANPDAMKTLWAQYTRTLQYSPDGKIVINAPVPLYDFVKTGLDPYVNMAKVTAEAEAAKRVAEQAAQRQNRNSRSDIFNSGKTDNLSEDEREWDAATKEYYGAQIGK